MPDPNNPADVPASWLPGAVQAHPKPPAYRAAVDRSIKNRRHTLVVDLAEKVHQFMRRLGTDDVVILEGKSDAWWRDLAVIAGHPSSDPSPDTRSAVKAKVSDYLADDKAKGRS